MQDAEWLAELLSYGLLKASYIPAQPQRDLRDLTRHRVKLGQERARIVNRLQKVLEHANIKLASVATDIMGVSGREMLAALVAGETEATVIAALAKGRLRNKMAALERALTGVVRPHHRFMLAQHLAHIDFLDEQITQVSDQIGRQIDTMSWPQEPDDTPPAGTAGPTWAESVALLDSAPGVNKKAAEIVLAAMGIDMTQFATAGQLTAWAGLAPGNNQSGSKRRHAKTREGNRTLRTIMVQIAWSAVRTKGSYAQALYRRLARRRGKKRAIMAVARSLLASFWYMLTRGEAYRELGGDYFDKRRKEGRVNVLTKQLAKLGYAVQLEPIKLQLDST